MRSFWRIFWLEWVGLVRSFTVVLLGGASIVWMFLVPHLVGDAPAEARALILRYSLGGVALLVTLTLTATATGSIARERAAGRLQLTCVRPVRHFVILLAKMAALSSVAVLVLSTAAGLAAFRVDSPRACRHVFRPVLLSPAREAELLYEAYMADPETPEEARRAPKSAVLRLLAQRAGERYQGVATNDVAVWPFPAGAFASRPAWLRLRVTNDWHLRDDVRLEARLGCLVACVTNLTERVSVFPLQATAERRTETTLELSNVGARAILLRPRRDVEILVEADGFYANLVRAVLELSALVTALIAFGVFLGCALSRPVALFTLFVTLALAEMSPSVLENYAGTLADGRMDVVALTLTRLTANVTHPISSLTPLSSLAADECVEPREVARTLFVDLLLLPSFFALLATFVLRRKTSDDV